MVLVYRKETSIPEVCILENTWRKLVFQTQCRKLVHLFHDLLPACLVDLIALHTYCPKIVTSVARLYGPFHNGGNIYSVQEEVPVRDVSFFLR